MSAKNSYFPLACAFVFVEYNSCMKILSLLFFILLAACGPKEIGQGSSEALPGSGNFSAAEQMRKPMTGANNTERMLYYYNRADVMEKVRNWRIEQFNRQAGITPEDPAYREHPKMASPFRE